MPSLDSKTAIVTGAGSGIGRATALRLAQAGARVFATDYSLDAAHATAALYGGPALALDVTDPAAWDAAIAAVVADAGRLDVLVNCAGILLAGPIVEATLADFDRLSRVHVEGPMLGMQRAIAQMRAQANGQPARGAIVNISSLAATRPFPDLPLYSTVKAALSNMSRAIGIEVGLDGDFIRVNCVHPGVVRTGMSEGLFDAATWDDAATFAHIPLGDYARPEDIAEAALFLASDDAKFMTSTAVTVDGGWTLV
ncbi:SDR family NAD(P)-dependent oxidoreductase [Parapedomonas caeni]|jgi:NAD(P)-dependent dehydrogenase (short-subunit alcohol dehydrogenase family)